jgi:hypothetical protein
MARAMISFNFRELSIFIKKVLGRAEVAIRVFETILAFFSAIDFMWCPNPSKSVLRILDFLKLLLCVSGGLQSTVFVLSLRHYTRSNAWGGQT